MYNHNTDNVWKAIGVDEDKLMKRLKDVTIDCLVRKRKPSEKIEKMANEFKKSELSAIIVMMEYRIRNLKEQKNFEKLIGYQ